MPTDNNIVKVIEAAHKRQAAQNELKLEIAKHYITKQIDHQNKLEEMKAEQGFKNQQAQIDNPQRYTPEQAYLKRRYMEENPLAQMSLPEEGDVQAGQPIGITQPKDEIVRDPKTQTFSQQPITQDRQAQLLISKVDQMVAQGRKPHPAVMRIADLARENLRLKAENKAAGIKPPSAGSNKYTGADAKLVSQAESLTTKLTTLKDMVGTPSENYLPWGGGTKQGQEFQTLRDDIKNTLLYLRSGAAVTPQEYKRLETLLPKLTRFKEVDKAQLDRFISEFQAIGDRIKQGRKYDEKTGKFSEASGSGVNISGANVDWDSAPEGATATDPDGSTWTKTNGEWKKEEA